MLSLSLKAKSLDHKALERELTFKALQRHIFGVHDFCLGADRHARRALPEGLTPARLALAVQEHVKRVARLRKQAQGLTVGAHSSTARALNSRVLKVWVASGQIVRGLVMQNHDTTSHTSTSLVRTVCVVSGWKIQGLPAHCRVCNRVQRLKWVVK